MLQPLCFFMDATNLVATNAFQSLSLWSIRLAMICLVACLALEILGVRRVDRRLSALWLLGALFSFGHSLGAFGAFHHFDHAEALESTATQTEAFLGVRVGAGLYVNYVFVAVWLWDASARMTAPQWYARLPAATTWIVYGFLIFIAINGTIVFKSGLIRGLGIACLVGLLLLWWQRKRMIART
jgi:hypothetical protein